MRNCQSCGAPLAEGAKVCTECGTLVNVVRPVIPNVELSKNPWSVTSVVIAALLLLLCLITAFVDSATFINRMYTTAIEWNLPLACIVATALGFIAAHKEGKRPLLGFVSVALLFVAFCFSNPTKNKVQDYVGNADNIVSIVAEGSSDNASNIGDWMEKIEKAGRKIQRAQQEYYEDKFRDERHYNSYDEYGYDRGY